jgi:predicted transcriptional regulator
MRISQKVLAAVPSSPGVMPLPSLARATGLLADQVKNAIDRLSKRGLVIHVGLARYQRTASGDAFLGAGKQVKPGPQPKGHGGSARRGLRADDAAGRDTLRDRAWVALRQLKKATIPDLMELASRGGDGEDVSNLRQYLTVLAKHGVVSALKRRAPGYALTSNGFIQYVLVDDLGPKAPLWRGSTGELVDRNNGKPIAKPEARR